jgi:hypothetical protein
VKKPAKVWTGYGVLPNKKGTRDKKLFMDSWRKLGHKVASVKN